jgi:hypothetical protein
MKQILYRPKLESNISSIYCRVLKFLLSNFLSAYSFNQYLSPRRIQELPEK